MMRHALALLLPLLLIAPAADAAAKGAAACARAPNAVEQAICADAALGKLDARLNEAWSRRRAGLAGVELEALLADQRAWLRGRAEACRLPSSALPANRVKGAADCLADHYRLRIAALNGSRPDSGPAKAKPGVDPALLHRAWLVNNRCQVLDFAATDLLGKSHDAALAGLKPAEWAAVRDKATPAATAVECNKSDQTAFVKQLAITLGDAR